MDPVTAAFGDEVEFQVAERTPLDTSRSPGRRRKAGDRIVKKVRAGRSRSQPTAVSTATTDAGQRRRPGSKAQPIAELESDGRDQCAHNGCREHVRDAAAGGRSRQDGAGHAERRDERDGAGHQQHVKEIGTVGDEEFRAPRQQVENRLRDGEGPETGHVGNRFDVMHRAFGRRVTAATAV